MNTMKDVDHDTGGDMKEVYTQSGTVNKGTTWYIPTNE